MTVHVFDIPRDDNHDRRDLEPGERHCTDPDAGEGVVFHSNAELVGLDHYVCVGCGATTGPDA